MARVRETLREASKGYALFGDPTGINPVSKVDAEILSQLFEIVLKLGADEDLVDLLNRYKNISDADMLAEIESYNSVFEGAMNEKNVMINILDQFIGSVNAIYSFTRASIYRNNRSMPVLIINKTENAKTPYANTQIIFSSEDEMEDEIEKIKVKLTKYTNLKFI